MLRLAIFCSRISSTDFSLNSSWLDTVILCSFSLSWMSDLEFLRSYRVVSSLCDCWMALFTSARSILETISNVFSGMD
jgi:hypothetical protein